MCILLNIIHKKLVISLVLLFSITFLWPNSIILHIRNSDGSPVTGVAENQNGYNGLLWKVYYIYGGKGSLISTYYLWGGGFFENGNLIVDIPFYIPVITDSCNSGFYAEPYRGAFIYFYLVDAHDGKEGEYDTVWVSCDTLLDIGDENYEKNIILHR